MTEETNKPTDNEASEPQASEQQASEQQASEQQASEQQASEQQASGQQATDKKSKSSRKETPAAPANQLSAVVKFRGEQFRVSPGQRLIMNRFESELGSSLVFEEVLILSSNNDGQQTVLVGSPLVSGAKVTAKVLAHDRGERVLVFKKKRRKGYTKSQGHRQERTHLLIEEIVASR